MKEVDTILHVVPGIMNGYLIRRNTLVVHHMKQNKINMKIIYGTMVMEDSVLIE